MKIDGDRLILDPETDFDDLISTLHGVGSGTIEVRVPICKKVRAWIRIAENIGFTCVVQPQ